MNSPLDVKNAVNIPTVAPMVPENAPFSTEQRAWLNGFFAGILSSGEGVNAEFDAGSSDSQPDNDPFGDGDDGQAPWHDQTMPLEERMELAEKRPLRRKMMAAMAQQDCGQCGYECETYANKIFLREEEKLNLCQPGGKATQRMLKKLFAELEEIPLNGNAAPGPETASVNHGLQPGYSREAPVLAKFISSERLNLEGSEKETNHIEFDLSDSRLDYEVGDSLGIIPTNCPELVGKIIDILGASPETEIDVDSGRPLTLYETLLEEKCLKEPPDELFSLLCGLSTDHEKQARLEAMANGEDPDSDLETLDVLATLEKFTDLTPDPKSFIKVLEPLQPRLYSISSSPLHAKDQVHLTVAAVRYEIGGRNRKGVASTFLADQLNRGDAISVYIQKAHGFALPENPDVPIIMVGPGTGVAPFRAFLQERAATGAKGKSWLFFGDQHAATDFLYRDELEAYLNSGVLTRLSTAFSRDESQKVYVQDRMKEADAEIWQWLKDGAHFYVCGDAGRMAADVDQTLRDIAIGQGQMTPDRASEYLKDLASKDRYQRDVY